MQEAGLWWPAALGQAERDRKKELTLQSLVAGRIVVFSHGNGVTLMELRISKMAAAAALLGLFAFAAPVPAMARKATATAAKSAEFHTEAAAKAHCPTGMVVWANLRSKVYHFAGSKNFGKTRRGAYMCENDATADGFRAAKNEKHP